MANGARLNKKVAKLQIKKNTATKKLQESNRNAAKAGVSSANPAGMKAFKRYDKAVTKLDSAKQKASAAKDSPKKTAKPAVKSALQAQGIRRGVKFVKDLKSVGLKPSGGRGFSSTGNPKDKADKIAGKTIAKIAKKSEKKGK
jgi:hypothetical protein